MTRWLVVSALVLLVGAALFGLSRSRTQSSGPSDEIVAYEVTAKQTVVVQIPAGIERVAVTSWLVIDPRAQYDVDEQYAYALDASVATSGNQEPIAHRHELSSRISGDPRAPASLAQYSARLVNSERWVADPRSTVIDVQALAGSGGRLVLRAGPGTHRRVLLRLAHGEQRTAVEQRLVKQKLDVAERRRLVDGRSALGFLDLPAPARSRVLATRGRRLSAKGREGVDYVTQRLLIGDFRSPPKDARLEAAATEVGPKRHIALNLAGALSLRLHAAPGTRFFVRPRLSDQSTQEAPIGADGYLDVPLPGVGARSVVVWSGVPTTVRFSIPRVNAHTQVGDVRQALRADGRVEIAPDVRVQRYFRLDKTKPVVVAIAPGQKVLGLSVRGVVAAPGEVQGEVLAHVAKKKYRFTALLRPTTFDRFPTLASTEPQAVMLRLPDGAKRVSLYGEGKLAVALWTREPDVTENKLRQAYEIALPDETAWRNAPYDLRSFSALGPDNQPQLAEDLRAMRLLAQVRIGGRSEGRGRRLRERVTLPAGRPARRQLLEPKWLSKTSAMPPNAWVLLGKGRKLRIESKGANARRLLVRYRSGVGQIGGDAQLLLNGREALRHSILFESGTLVTTVEPGAVSAALRGLGRRGLALANAAPANGGQVLRQRSVYELPSRRALEFVVPLKSGELTKLLVSVISEGSSREFSIDYQVRSGSGQPPRGFVRRATRLEGTLSGRTGAEGRALIWDRDALPKSSSALADRVALVRIPLGDDLGKGRHKVRLRLRSGPKRLWLRAVLVGRAHYAPVDALDGADR